MEIQSGLSKGERIITGPYSAVSRELEPGTKIQTSDDDPGSGQVVAASQ
jgi:HlyD family secretion protein